MLNKKFSDYNFGCLCELNIKYLVVKTNFQPPVWVCTTLLCFWFSDHHAVRLWPSDWRHWGHGVLWGPHSSWKTVCQKEHHATSQEEEGASEQWGASGWQVFSVFKGLKPWNCAFRWRWCHSGTPEETQPEDTVIAQNVFEYASSFLTDFQRVRNQLAPHKSSETLYTDWPKYYDHWQINQTAHRSTAQCSTGTWTWICEKRKESLVTALHVPWYIAHDWFAEVSKPDK